MLATQLISALALTGAAFSQSTTRPSANLTTCTPYPASPAQQHEIFEVFAKLNLTQAFTHVAANEIQHNPFLPNGAVSQLCESTLPKPGGHSRDSHWGQVPWAWVHGI
ncbi:hypothetical protein C8R44DRAFT_896284 [Mycena epipterygia]|nr:hypothetical protein C8R44DRAFT_896284 [Mycena epipterygia]